MREFWLCFVPLFVAVDAIGVLPLFMSLTERMDPPRRRSAVAQSFVTASLVAVAFLAFGPAILKFLGITVSDFMIAGGALLFAISLSDLLTGVKRLRHANGEGPGAVPIGVPLITGPAVLTTCILLANTHGKALTATAALLNIAIAAIVFLFATPISRALGSNGTKTVSKIASLLLASIAVMLVRRGIMGAIHG